MALNCIELDQQLLPENFAERVLQLEATVDEQNCDITSITNLSDLYRMAVEHFEKNQNESRSKHYQRKLSRLLMSPRTLQLIDNRVKKVDTTKPILQASLKDQLDRFNVQAQQYINSMVKQSEKKLIKSQTLIKLDIDRQQENLQTRLLRRAKSRKIL